jgi:hypothetical protein
MKLHHQLALLLTMFCCTNSSAQLTYDEACKALKIAEKNIDKLDQDIIYKIQTTSLTPLNVSLPAYQFLACDPGKQAFISNNLNKYERTAVYAEDTLMRLLGIGDTSFNLQRMEALLGCLESSAALDWLEYALNLNIERGELCNNHVNTSEYMFKKIRTSIRKRLNEIMEREFTFYRVSEAAKKPIKGLYLDHANDFFFPGYNDDRDMTGSFRIEVFTDWLKIRIMSPFTDNPLNFNGRAWYSHQSLVIGGEGYTGYLRDTSRYRTLSSVDSTDRPFASTVYFGRAKYRLFNDGFYKVNSLIRVGSIGAGGPDKVQSTIHRDITVGSLKPNGWGAQIAAGGRISINYEVTHEKMLISEGLFLTKGLTKRLNYFKNNAPSWINLSLPVELKVGHELTSITAGLNLSNMNFKTSGGINMPFTNHPVSKKYDWLKNHFGINYKYSIRYVVRNPLLEGYGIFKHKPDEDPASPIDRYILTKGQVNQWIQFHEINASIKLKFVAVIFGFKVWSPEFNLPVNHMRYTGSPKGHEIHNAHPWNHIGKLGLLFGFE